MPKLNVGDVAPDFSLSTETGETVKLSEKLAAGPVVLIFYPGDSTPGCTKQLCTVRDDRAQYADAGLTVFGVNNGGPDSHAKFITKHGLGIPLLVDKDFAVATNYDSVVGFGPLRLTNRTVVGIGKDGRVAYYKRGMPSTSEIITGVTNGR
jgi:peroxiredoxin Q/BCP